MRLFRLRTSVGRITALAALATVGMLVVPGAAASASSPTPTEFVNLSATPSVLSYPGGTVTVSGELEAGGSCPTSFAKAMFAVLVNQGGAGNLAINVRTDSTCGFSAPITEVVAAPVVLQYSGDSEFAGTSQTVGVTAGQVYPAQIQIDPIKPARAESTVTVHGTVYMDVNGSSVPSPYAPISYVQQGSFRQTYADQNGQFRISVGAYPGQAVTVSTPASQQEFWWSGAYTTAPFYVPLTVDPTAVVNIGVDQTPSPVGSIGLSIHVVSVDAAGTGSNYSGPVHLFFQPAAGGSWTLMAKATTNANGFVDVTVSGYLSAGALAAGNWKWVVPAEPGFGASGTQPFAVVITVPTKISGLKFARSGAKERLTGRLSYRTAGVADAPVVIQHFSGGHWRNVATVRTSSSGGFAYTFSRRLTGRYRVLYRGAALPGAEASFGSFKSTLSGAVRFT